jgi:hypothetical protein
MHLLQPLGAGRVNRIVACADDVASRGGMRLRSLIWKSVATTVERWVPNPRTLLYVTRGLGEQLPLSIRINSKPEIFVLRPRSAGQQPA